MSSHKKNTHGTHAHQQQHFACRAPAAFMAQRLPKEKQTTCFAKSQEKCKASNGACAWVDITSDMGVCLIGNRPGWEGTLSQGDLKTFGSTAGACNTQYPDPEQRLEFMQCVNDTALNALDCVSPAVFAYFQEEQRCAAPAYSSEAACGAAGCTWSSHTS